MPPCRETWARRDLFSIRKTFAGSIWSAVDRADPELEADTTARANVRFYRAVGNKPTITTIYMLITTARTAFVRPIHPIRRQNLVMNSSLAAGYGAPEFLLDALAAATAKLLVIGDSGFRSVAASRDGATARAPKDKTREASGIASGANARHGRFQREIVPHLDSAYNFARFLSRNADAAQDIVQETFLRAYRSFDGYQGGDARAWIFAIVRNCYHNWLLEGRRKARLEVDVHRRCDAADFSVDQVASDDDTPETALLRRSEAGNVRSVLNKLPRSLREVLVLRELEGLSYRQIADASSLPVGTVMSRLARARTQFGSLWRQEAERWEGQK
jgi:RNA polymerase sigma factor (sigma-70 family)